jgi:hypothetical protein
VRFAGQRREEVYGWVEKTLVRFQYTSLDKPGKGLVRRYLSRMTGLSRARVTRYPQFSFRHYGAAEGLQNLTVLSLAQCGAGYIRAGSEGGLYRYDGTRFRLMSAAEGLPCSTEVHALHVAADGSLWDNPCSRLFRFDGGCLLQRPSGPAHHCGRGPPAKPPGGFARLGYEADWVANGADLLKSLARGS